ncbi:MAG: hypothetical protein FJX74_26200 [Armatimonadetes bacterium]|nr:hypothetical protein [Armatimonadota bacterium]
MRRGSGLVVWLVLLVLAAGCGWCQNCPKNLLVLTDYNNCTSMVQPVPCGPFQPRVMGEMGEGGCPVYCSQNGQDWCNQWLCPPCTYQAYAVGVAWSCGANCIEGEHCTLQPCLWVVLTSQSCKLQV